MIICSPQLGLAPNSVLGGEVFDREILLGLAKKNVKIEIILPIGKPFDKNVHNWNLTFVPISHFPAFAFNFIIIPHLFSIYFKKRFEIIRIHQPQFIGLGSLIFKVFFNNVKLVATFHQFRESNFGPFSKLINRSWDLIICDSISVKNKLIKKYQIKSSKISVVHNGVPTYLKPTKKDPKLIKKFDVQNKIILLFMGLFIERKNPIFLLDVLSKLAKSRPDFVMIFWGKGPLESQILKKANLLGLKDKIRIQKPLYGPDKNKIHNLADIFVHPSTDEGFALAPLEAMACAKPVVITDGYSSVEAVDDGVNGFLCGSNDLNHWSEKLKTLISKEKIRHRMGQASLSKVKKQFQWNLAVETHLKVFNKLK